MRRQYGWVLYVAAVMALGGGGVLAEEKDKSQTATAEAARNVAVETRTYNVADLVRMTPDYPFESDVRPPTGWGKGEDGRSAFMQQSEEKEKKGGAVKVRPGIGMKELIQVIEGNIEPGSWMDAGGTTGTIQPLGSLLVVTQTTANQKRVEDLIAMIRKEYGPLKTVGVSARWVLLSPEQARQMMAAGKGTVTVVDEGFVGKLPADALWAAGRTACFSGQTVYVASGRGRTAVTKAQPVVGTNAVAYDVTADLIQSGAVLQVTPLLSPDGQTAVLDLVSVATDWGEVEGGIDLGGTSGDRGVTTRPSAKLDRINVGVQQMRTTVRVPVGKAVVVGGMTREPGTDEKQLYLIAEVTAAE